MRITKINIMRLLLHICKHDKPLSLRIRSIVDKIVDTSPFVDNTSDPVIHVILGPT